jgi:hypothetical protein
MIIIILTYSPTAHYILPKLSVSNFETLNLGFNICWLCAWADKKISGTARAEFKLRRQ